MSAGNFIQVLLKSLSSFVPYLGNYQDWKMLMQKAFRICLKNLLREEEGLMLSQYMHMVQHLPFSMLAKIFNRHQF